MLVIGLGQIGTAVRNILLSEGIDQYETLEKKFDFIHICYPYSSNFIDSVKEYKRTYLNDGGICVIHSTVPVGTSKLCEAVHSPVRGIHPHLETGIRTFIKYFGGKDADRAAKVFSDLGIKTRTTPNSDTVEALKLWDTTIYAWNVILEKEIFRYCQEHDVDFDLVYRDANLTYNGGYELLGHPEYKKYVLKHVPGPIGGHCLIPNCKLLKSWITELIIEKNNEVSEK